MVARVFDYTNSFETDLGSATSLTSAGAVGLVDAPTSGDADNEYSFFAGDGEFARLDLHADVAADERVAAFNVTMQLDINGTNGEFGNSQPDGMSFNLTDPVAFPDSALYEIGPDVGLSVQVMPYAWNSSFGNHLRITWNGQVLATTPLGTTGVDQGPQPLSISVDRAGNVTASWGPDISASGTIPDDEWATTDQTGWDFIIAGRAGGNGGDGYMDDIDLTARVACFTRGTLIETDKGPRAIETLQAGDLVWTLDAGHQPIRWIGETRLDAQALARAPHLRPIRIAAGALGDGTPSRDLLVKRSTPPNATGRVYGVVYAGLDIGQAVAPLVFGRLMDHGQYVAVIVGLALVQGVLIAIAPVIGSARVASAGGAIVRALGFATSVVEEAEAEAGA